MYDEKLFYSYIRIHRDKNAIHYVENRSCSARIRKSRRHEGDIYNSSRKSITTDNRFRETQRPIVLRAYSAKGCHIVVPACADWFLHPPVWAVVITGLMDSSAIHLQPLLERNDNKPGTTDFLLQKF